MTTYTSDIVLRIVSEAVMLLNNKHITITTNKDDEESDDIQTTLANYIIWSVADKMVEYGGDKEKINNELKAVMDDHLEEIDNGVTPSGFYSFNI